MIYKRLHKSATSSKRKNNKKKRLEWSKVSQKFSRRAAQMSRCLLGAYHLINPETTLGKANLEVSKLKTILVGSTTEIADPEAMAASLGNSSQMKRKEREQLIPDGNTRRRKILQSQVSLETLALTYKHLRTVA